eukprot:TRINITY_DN6649_c1_g1_i1.p1 TRINITY_DN6649_c1_g1~~TRINITY_DN6649_c1_g1_i1.p1  ORF type:complete len:399 (+),score=143.27 TRINITY_DN6649_c1_g1_i1:318-1514(+)
MQAAKTSMSSKIIGLDSDKFAQIVVDAVTSIKVTSESSGKTRYPIKSINVMKSQGKSAAESALITGYALNCRRASEFMPKSVKNAKIALLDINLQKQRMKMGVQVLVEDPRALEEIREREHTLIRDKLEMIFNAGANVVLTTKGIDDYCLKYFVDKKALGVRRVTKEDMRRIAKITGGKVVLTLADMEGEEQFDASCLGHCDEVAEERVADDQLIYFKGCKTSRAATILLRGPNEQMLDEMDRSVHDAVCVIKRVLESQNVVPGGGACEAALSIYLQNFATTLGSREQLAIAEFAEALLVIPKTLAVNSALDATDLVAKLRAYHNTSQSDSTRSDLKNSGLDLLNGKIVSMTETGVLEPAISKLKSLQFATEAAITILRIDDVIKLSPPQEQQDPHGH